MVRDTYVIISLFLPYCVFYSLKMYAFILRWILVFPHIIRLFSRGVNLGLDCYKRPNTPLPRFFFKKETRAVGLCSIIRHLRSLKNMGAIYGPCKL